MAADGVPEKLLSVIKCLYSKTLCAVRAYGDSSSSFEILTGVRQGALLSPLSFNAVIDWVMRHALCETDGVVCVSGGGRISDLDYADDLAIFAESETSLQEMLDRICFEGSKVGLRINAAKTKVLSSCCPPPKITIGADTLENVDSFCYLGAQITATADPSGEIGARVSKAQGAFMALYKDLWRQKDVCTEVKLHVYLATVRATLLYGCETWPEKRLDLRRAQSFEMRCFRTILKIRLDQRIPNTEVLRRMGNPTPLAQEIKKRRLRWLGHILRMEEGRHPKETFLFEPSELPPGAPRWRRPRGGVRKTWKRTIKDDFDHSDLKDTYGSAVWHKNWLSILQDLAMDRRQWKKIVQRTVQRSQTPGTG